MKFPFCCSKCFSSPSDAAAAVVDESTHANPGEQTPQSFPVFSYRELRSVTHGFQNKIGEGGFGSVYKGRLQDGTVVAVKVLSVDIESMRGEREFISEIAALSAIKHENLVSLRGCCVHGAERFLVYDYMENNSLARTLLGREQNRIKFGWELRWAISLGVARGLAYLHEEVAPHIAHRDIKASNILLDQNFTPKVSDFGLSRLFTDNASHISTRVAGTLGYVAPEYAQSGHLTRKSDVYGFGVLLLEIISGRSVVVFDMEHGEHHLVEKAWEMHMANELLQLVDPTLKDFPQEEAVRFLKVGLLCVQEAAGRRPQMSAAIKMLTNEIDIDDAHISKPGVVANLRDVKVGHIHSSQSIISKATSSTNFF
ncbi:putative serine/threonine-protein kinase [Malania oleifera]|uniref:putative serine/threonine-protein kinase n=1 Tax=Malania oleifera TaxID=397392 RepID=UPI0025AEC4E3|nr:putative serine/threonine-protein kinase [Malania oleifera]